MGGLLSKITFKDNWAIASIAALGCIINLLLYLKLGTKVVIDSHRFIGYADQILSTGFFIDLENIWYLGYVLFLTICKASGFSLNGIVALQCCVSVGASIFVYLTAKELCHPMAGLIAACLFLFSEVSQWNAYLMCESLFISMTAITFYFIFKKNRHRLTELVTVLAVAVTFLIKPTGIVILAAGLAFIVSRLNLTKLQQWSRAVLFGLLIILIGNGMVSKFNLVEEYSTGDIVFHCHALESNCPEVYKLETSDLNLTGIDGQPLVRVVKFAVQNPLYFIKLCLAKLLAFWIHLKPYFSVWHNFFLILTLIPCYYFMKKGISETARQAKAFSLTYLTLTSLVVMLTVEDWDGRFFMPMMPLIFIFAACGFTRKVILQNV